MLNSLNHKWDWFRLGRRWTSFACHVPTSLALLSTAFFTHSNQPLLSIVAWLIAKFGVATSYLAFYAHGSEVFPTVTRSACLGFFSLSARLAASATPIEPSLAAIAEWLPAVTLSAVAMVPILMIWVLPEVY